MRKLVVLVPLVAVLAACQPVDSGAPVVATSSAAGALDPWSLPDPHLTPGAVQSTDVADVCPHVNPDFEKHRPGTSVKNRVYAAYGITSHPTGVYEVDHLIPLELGGANTPANLWPEPNDHPASHPNGNSKDELEDTLHRLVCAGHLSLVVAQDAIRVDWVAAYRRYVGPTG